MNKLLRKCVLCLTACALTIGAASDYSRNLKADAAGVFQHDAKAILPSDVIIIDKNEDVIATTLLKHGLEVYANIDFLADMGGGTSRYGEWTYIAPPINVWDNYHSDKFQWGKYTIEVPETTIGLNTAIIHYTPTVALNGFNGNDIELNYTVKLIDNVNLDVCDVDANGEVTFNDFFVLRDFLTRKCILEKPKADAADLNGDGIVNIVDGVMLKNRCFKSR